MFSDHVALLERFLSRRHDIVERIERTLLNVRGRGLSRSRDRRQFERLLTACFFEAPGIPRDAVTLKGQLAAAHLADGFEPVRLDRHTLEFDPHELIPRAYLFWDATRWPGSSGRLRSQIRYRVWNSGRPMDDPELISWKTSTWATTLRRSTVTASWSARRRP